MYVDELYKSVNQYGYQYQIRYTEPPQNYDHDRLLTDIDIYHGKQRVATINMLENGNMALYAVVPNGLLNKITKLALTSVENRVPKEMVKTTLPSHDLELLRHLQLKFKNAKKKAQTLKFSKEEIFAIGHLRRRLNKYADEHLK